MTDKLTQCKEALNQVEQQLQQLLQHQQRLIGAVSILQEIESEATAKKEDEEVNAD